MEQGQELLWLEQDAPGMDTSIPGGLSSSCSWQDPAARPSFRDLVAVFQVL